MSALLRNNVHQSGWGDTAMVFAHGFGCDQNMWRFVAPAFQPDYRTVLFDHVGAGRSDLTAYDPRKYATLGGYADDLVEVCREANVKGGIFVGHSVSAMIGLLASIRAPDLFSCLVLVSPSPRYIDDAGYRGGFSEAEIEELLASMDDNFLGWSAAMAPTIMGNSERPELGEELANSFCRTDPTIAKAFARVTFTSDNRLDLSRASARTIILQCKLDVIAGPEVGRYVHEQISGSELVILDATGHCPNLSAPAEVIAAIRAHV